MIIATRKSVGCCRRNRGKYFTDWRHHLIHLNLFSSLHIARGKRSGDFKYKRKVLRNTVVLPDDSKLITFIWCETYA